MDKLAVDVVNIMAMFTSQDLELGNPGQFFESSSMGNEPKTTWPADKCASHC